MATAGAEDQRSVLRILALDGGGVRGLSSLFILRELMTRIAVRTRKRTVRPCECFELIIGTGTGGISALFLGRMRMSVEQAIEEYMRLAETAFKPKSARIPRLLSSQTAPLDGTVLEEAIGDIVQRITGDRDAPFADREDETCCRTVVLAATTHNVDAPPYIFQSCADNTRPASDHVIRDVARATSSTGGLFEAVTLGNPPIQFTDAGTSGYNNPSEIALRMAERLWPEQPVDCIVSLGTGLQRIISLDNRRIADACKSLVENCEQVHDRLQHGLHGQGSYFRFNVDRGLDSVDIMEWRQAGPQGVLSGITDSYMRWKEVDDRLNSCVNAIHGDKSVTIQIPNHPVGVPELRDHTPRRGEYPGTIDSLPMFNPASGLRNNPGGTMPKRDNREIRKFLPISNPRPQIFHGRYSDIEKAASLLEGRGSAHIAILGTGGIGKTSIALTLLHDPRVEEKFQSHRRFLACESVNSPSQLVATLCAAVGLEDGSKNGLEDLLFFLNEERVSCPLLIVLDNFETVWDVEDAKPDAEKIICGLESVSSLSIVLTMRGAEQPVGICWSLVLLVSPLDSCAARSTFVDVRRRDHVDDEDLDELLEAVDYVPLAITLMARLGQNESPKVLLKRWEVERTRLLSRPRDRDRLNSVDVSIEISINSHRMKSNPEALRLLSVISALPSGVFLDDLRSVCPRVVDLDEMSAMLREVGLAYYDSGSTLRVLSPIRLYTLRYHAIPPELLEDVRSFYFTLSWQALQEQRKSAPGFDIASDVVANTLRNASNIEAIITDALTLELETDGRQEHPESVAAALNWTEFIWYRRARTTVIELGVRVARLRQARCEVVLAEQDSSTDTLAPTTMDNGAGLTDTSTRHSFTLLDDILSGDPDPSVQQRADRLDGSSADRCTETGWNAASGSTNGIPKDDSALLGGTLILPAVDSDGHTGSLKANGVTEDVVSEEHTPHKLFEAALPHRTPEYYAWLTVASCLYHLGVTQAFTHDFDTAEITLCEARDMYQSVKDEVGAAQCLHNLGHIYLHTRRLDLAREAYIEAATLFRATDDRIGLVQCELAIGNIQWRTGNHDAARVTFVKVRNELVLENDSTGIGMCLWHLGHLQMSKLEFEPARNTFTEVVALFKADDRPIWVADGLLDLASAQESMAEYDAAITTLTQAQEIYKGLDHMRGVAVVMQRSFQIQRKKGDLDAAKEGMARVVKAFARLNDSRMVATCYLDLADIYMDTTEYEAAREALTEASARFQALNDERWIALCNKDWGHLQMKTYELDLAWESFNNALRCFQANRDLLGSAVCLWYLGDVHNQKYEYEIAHGYFAKALEIFESINDRAWAGECMLSLGTVLRFTGNDTSAREMLERARQEFETMHDQRGVARALFSLVTFARLTGYYEYAHELIAETKRAFEALNDRHAIARTYWQLANICIGTFDYDGARNALADSRREFEILKDLVWLARCDLCCGHLDRLGGELDSAEKMILKAQDVFTINHDLYGVAESFYYLGKIHRQRYEFETAIQFFSEALQAYTSLDNRRWMGNCLLGIGNAECAMGRYDFACNNFTQAREHFQFIHYDSGVQFCQDKLKSISPSMLQLQGNSDLGASGESDDNSRESDDINLPDRPKGVLAKIKTRLRKRSNRR